uniref:PX domain-containing protein n=1 Tax=Hyaloperonospora arabidopsidis (strain Emoy2) TaxID=559515 RepID=M4BVK8_HYAAE
MNVLSASITSALALKPSTVYILRVKNSKTRQRWHVRRRFTDFCELRGKLLALIDDQMAMYLTCLEVDDTESSFCTTGSDVSSSASSSVSTRNSCRGKNRHDFSPPPPDRFCYVFKQFPSRKLFGSRSERVIKARSVALNLFLQQALEVVEVVRQRRLIAIGFSMMTHIESFLECRAHRTATSVASPSASDCKSETVARRQAVSPSRVRRKSAARSHSPQIYTTSRWR